MRIHVLTMFPPLMAEFSRTSLIGKAVEQGVLEILVSDLREFTHDRHRSVDDTPYGGGSGMVLKPEPILEALASRPRCHRILLTPQGRRFDQQRARQLSELDEMILFCGRYEGVDERVRSRFDEELSLGDFVVQGGEVAAMAVIEAVSRLVAGVLGNAASPIEESFTGGALEYPQYTKPEVVEGEAVPAVLLSGDHGRIARWRLGQALLRTRERRPDLFAALELTRDDLDLLAEVERERGR